MMKAIKYIGCDNMDSFEQKLHEYLIIEGYPEGYKHIFPEYWNDIVDFIKKYYLDKSKIKDIVEESHQEDMLGSLRVLQKLRKEVGL